MLSFKKGDIFDRSARAQESFMDEPGNQVLATWGSPRSDKSTMAVKLTKYLVRKKWNVVLLTRDMTALVLPCICPSADLGCKHSLGSVLATVQVTQSLVRHSLITRKKYDCLTLMGILREKNEYTYPPYSAKQVTELITCLWEMAPYVVIDCGSYIANDILSTIALMESGAALRLVNCNLRSTNYPSNQLSLLRDNKWDTDKQYKVTSNIRPNEAGEHVEQVLGSVTFKLSYCTGLAAQSLAGGLLADLPLRESKGFRKVIEVTSREVFGC